MKQVFPKEILENTAEVHQFKHSTKSKSIYGIILLLLIAAFMVLPFIKVDVVSTARGIIKPNKERVGISLISSGRVLFSHLAANKLVAKGDTLVVLNNEAAEQELQLAAFKTRETLSYIKDLSLLLHQKRIQITELASPKYQKGYLHYRQKLRSLQIRVNKTRQDYERYQLLYKKGVVARVEYEDYKFELDLAMAEMVQHRKQQQNSWQADLSQYNNTLNELQAGKEQLVQNKSRAVITAPVSGTLFDVNQLEAGSYVASGMVLAHISPSTDLLVECYVSPAEIGLIRENTPTNFQIDAYNYNQWGLASGRVKEIGSDIEMLEGKGVFKVRCSLDQEYLFLKNGFRGNLKKGMSLNANFRLNRRTLFQLLYDKMDDWLNPTTQKN